ncbi:MAG: DUF2662 domain-containing protein [Selenomonas ruminantium]|jgi:hypothetical protein|uniref:DUF2662 domain-containing protein n=1 Tax=Selenomonas ruminantium TaxID=971 RepID=A0A927WHK1_SELRU|nr:FhaA domain-containing protein [Selenomonas ruminantium]MBE6084605.1 DUF2662 domain-containing protein [Selenomonas ruminantium]
MLDRIERVARVKGVESAIDRSFERKEGYNESKKNKQSFEKALTKEMEKEVRPANEAGLGVPNAYRLELSARPTQSLFYREMVDISDIEGKINTTV